MSGADVQVETAQGRQRVRYMAERAADFTPLWPNVNSILIGLAQATFEANARGGTHRGVTWEWFADQYTRKTDGVTVPAEGGVPRIRGGISAREISGKVRDSGVAMRLFLGDGGAPERRTYYVPGREMVVGSRFGTPSPVGGSSVLAVLASMRTDDEPMVRGKLRPSGTRVTKESKLMQDNRGMIMALGQSTRSMPMEFITSVNVGYAGEQNRMRPFWFIQEGVDDVRIRGLMTQFVMGEKAVPSAPAGSLLAALERSA